VEASQNGGILVTTLTDPSQEKARQHGVRATRYTVEADGSELAEIASLATSGKLKPYIQKTYPLRAAADALASVEGGHAVGKIVMTMG
jgi:NADPH:quinone reductase-like Zn-dependent oxidoreductase